MSGLINRFQIGLLIIGLWVICGTLVVKANEADDYQRSFDAYRDSYEIFEIKRTDYVQSKTFAAEESLVIAAKTMLLNRADTWNNFWKVVATNTEAQEWLTKHKDALNQQKTKSGLNIEASLLNEKLDKYLTTAYERNVEIIDQKFLESLNQVKKLNEDLLSRAQNQNIEQSKKDLAIRGLTLNVERLNNLEQESRVMKTDLMSQSSGVNLDEFSEITALYQPLYQQMIQYMQITRELSENIEW